MRGFPSCEGGNGGLVDEGDGGVTGGHIDQVGNKTAVFFAHQPRSYSCEQDVADGLGDVGEGVLPASVFCVGHWGFSVVPPESSGWVCSDRLPPWPFMPFW